MKARWLIMLTGIVLLGACKKRSYERINAASADSVQMDSTPDKETKLVKTADISFKVNSVSQSSENISAMVKHFKGMVTHRQSSSEAVEKTDIRQGSDSVIRITSVSTTGNITLRVPTVKLDSFINKIDQLAIYISNQSIDITDKTLEYLSSSMKLRDRVNFTNQQKTGKVVIKNPIDVLQLEDDKTDEEISNRQINDMVHYSTVTLQFYQNNTINREVMANDNVNSYNPPFFTRLTLALKSGWDLFVDLIVGLANIWVLLLTACAAWFIYKRVITKRTIAPKA